MSRPRVLVASADQDFRQLAETACHEREFEAVLTDSDEQVLEAVDSLHPGLLIVDLDGHQRDGVRLLRLLAERHHSVPVVLVGSCDLRTLAAAERVGTERGVKVQSVLRKPVVATQLARVLFETLSRGHHVVSADDIREAMRLQQFRLHYQPLVDIHTGSVHGCEVLLRWQHPTYGNVEPSRVIPVAEESGLITPLTDWILEASLQQYARWARQGWTFRIAINVEAEVLRDTGFADRVASIVHESGVRPDRVILEVTESQTITEEVQVLETLTRLRLAGLELAIDDFGTGYSSLGRLHQLPFSELKIDKSFVLDAEHNPQAEIIVRMISHLGRSLGMVVVAEGVQSRETMDLVRELECDVAQGFFVSRALAADDFTDWLYRWGVTSSVNGRELIEDEQQSMLPVFEQHAALKNGAPKAQEPAPSLEPQEPAAASPPLSEWFEQPDVQGAPLTHWLEQAPALRVRRS